MVLRAVDLQQRPGKGDRDRVQGEREHRDPPRHAPQQLVDCLVLAPIPEAGDRRREAVHEGVVDKQREL